MIHSVRNLMDLDRKDQDCQHLESLGSFQSKLKNKDLIITFGKVQGLF